MSERTIGSNNPYAPVEMLVAPFVIGKAAFEMVLTSTISIARMAQIAAQSADTALAKYIQLTEGEIQKGQRKESVRVE
jgi:hypothetical protein